MDSLTPEKRRALMGRIRGKDTAPELAVRQMLYYLGYRYRLYRADLPGKPDLAFISRKKAIFVHGCFWHGHNCGRGTIPKTNTEFWIRKIKGTNIRDQLNYETLKKLGWSYLVVWECEL